MSAVVSRLGHIYGGGEQKWAQHVRHPAPINWFRVYVSPWSDG